MKRFIFRAQAALDLRRREHEAAQRVLAAAEREVARALEVCTAAEAALARALDDATQSASVASSSREFLWHRNWIIGKRHETVQCREQLAARRAEQAAAAAREIDARRRFRALEKLRDNMRLAHARAEAQQEQKMLDLHGSIQFAAKAVEEAQ